MVFYVERKRRRPDDAPPSAIKSALNNECQLFECDNKKQQQRSVRLIPKPPVFNLTQPPSPFGLLNLGGGNENGDSLSRDKFLLFYLNHDLAASSNSPNSLDDIRDKCNNLKIQMLAGSGSNELFPSLSVVKSSPGSVQTAAAPAGGGSSGYNFIRSKIMTTNNGVESSLGTKSVHHHHMNSNNSSLNNRHRNDTGTTRLDGMRDIVGAAPVASSPYPNSNLFSSFLYSFSILFVLFIFFFFIYLYYSK